MEANLVEKFYPETSEKQKASVRSPLNRQVQGRNGNFF